MSCLHNDGTFYATTENSADLNQDKAILPIHIFIEDKRSSTFYSPGLFVLVSHVPDCKKQNDKFGVIMTWAF